MWVENGGTPQLDQNAKSITCTMDNTVILVVSRLSSKSSSILSSISRTKGQSNYSRKFGTLSGLLSTRSDKHACGIPMLTDHDKVATANREPANDMNKWAPTQGIPAWLQPFTVNLEGPGGTCARTFLWKSELRLGRWGFKSAEAQCSWLTSVRTKRYLFCEQNRLVNWKQLSEMWISEQTPIRCRGTSSRRSVDSVSNQKLHRRRRIYESSQKPSHKPKVIHTFNLWEYGEYCEELSWNHRTTALHQSDTRRIAEWAVRRGKEETSAVSLQSGSDDEWWLASLKCSYCLRNDLDILADGKNQMNEDLENPSRTCFARGVNFGKKIFLLLRLKNWKS